MNISASANVAIIAGYVASTFCRCVAFLTRRRLESVIRWDLHGERRTVLLFPQESELTPATSVAFRFGFNAEMELWEVMVRSARQVEQVRQNDQGTLS